MVNSAPHVGLMKIPTTMSNMGKTDNFIDFIRISRTINFERKGSGHSENSLNKIFAGMTKKGVFGKTVAETAKQKCRFPAPA
tara:strand:- start:625 stop:870 length:246 start_codon:yes stop_codon:yes gene_type:complete